MTNLPEISTDLHLQPSPKVPHRAKVTPAQLDLMAVFNPQDPEGNNLSTVAVGLYLRLASVGNSGTYPGAGAASRVLKRVRSAVYTAERILESAKLVTFFTCDGKTSLFQSRSR